MLTSWLTKKDASLPSAPKKNALILSGGGARAAYQVGVLKALTQILPASTRNPFPIICGTSAGAINALALATHAGNFSEAVTDLEQTWHNLAPGNVYRSDTTSLMKGFGRLLFSLFNEGIGRTKPVALLDNAPLRELLEETIQFQHIDRAIQDGDLDAVCITAMGYSTGQSISFFQGRPDISAWQRHRREGRACRLTVEHLMASSAIPTVFPTVYIDREYFGDGALRQVAPISPALHLGANRVLVIGVSGNRNPEPWSRCRPVRHSPSMAQIMGHLLNSAFIDALEGDIEHLERVNDLLSLVPREILMQSGLPLQPVENLIISPSEALDKIAGRKIRYLSKSLRLALRAVGATAHGGGATAASYLLFEPQFCQTLIELGYKDTMWERAAIEQFFD